MAAVVSYLSLAGVWLVFAGAVYQATLELRAEVAAQELFIAGHKMPRTEPVSAWWWLVPPVYIVLTSRRIRSARTAFLESLTTAELATLVGYMNKAAGWQLVGMGGFFLAVHQTHQFAHERADGESLFLALSVGAAFLSSGLVKLFLRRGEAALRLHASRGPIAKGS